MSAIFKVCDQNKIAIAKTQQKALLLPSSYIITEIDYMVARACDIARKGNALSLKLILFLNCSQVKLNMKRLSFAGIVIIILAIFTCFAYSFYQIDQLQSQIKTLLQGQNVNQGHMTVLNYNWSVRYVRDSMYLITVNSTFFNDSPLNRTYVPVNLNAQFRDKTMFGYFSVGNFGPYTTKNENFPVVYNASEYFDMTSPDSVWLEFP
jgi:hypothetical protein